MLRAARTYAEIRYWTAPAVMANLALIGFLVGQRRMTAVLVFEIVYNLANIALGLWFVLALDFGIAGIGWSSFIAEYGKLALVGAFVFRGAVGAAVWTALRQGTGIGWTALRPFLSVNRDLFLRTVVLMLALAALTRLSAERGAVVLAANGILYQMFVLTALLLDGFENAAQVLNGERFGARDRAGFVAVIRATLWRGFAAACVVALGFALFADPLLANFAATDAVASAAQAQAGMAGGYPVRRRRGLRVRRGVRRLELDARAARHDAGGGGRLCRRAMADLAAGQYRAVAQLYRIPRRARGGAGAAVAALAENRVQSAVIGSG